MSNWNGQVSKVHAAQQEKNHWKRRAGNAEGVIKYMRNVVDNPDTPNDEVVDALVRLIDGWEDLAEMHERGNEPKCHRCRGTGLLNAGSHAADLPIFRDSELSS